MHTLSVLIVWVNASDVIPVTMGNKVRSRIALVCLVRCRTLLLFSFLTMNRQNHDRGSSFAETKLDLICLTHFFLPGSHSKQENNEKSLTYS